MVLAAVAGDIVKSHAEPRYQSAVQVLVGPITGDDSSLSAAGQLVQTYAEVVTTQPLLSATIEDLGLSISPGELRSEVSASASDITRLLTIRVADHDPAQAAQIANSLAANLAEFASTGPTDPETGVGRPESELQGPRRLLRRRAPRGPGRRSWSWSRRLPAGRPRHRAHRRIHPGHGSKRRRGGGAERGRLPRLCRRPSPTVYRQAAPGGDAEFPGRDELPSHRHGLQFSGDRELSSVLILGAQPGDQTGEVAANIAVAFAEAGLLVSLVDANPEEGAITKLFQLQGRPGIGDVFLRDRGAAKAPGDPTSRSRRVERPPLDVIPLGRADGADVVDLQNARDFLQTLLRERDLVIVNASSVERSSGALVWARSVDGTMIVARRDHTKRSVLARAAESLRLVGATLIGCALNQPSSAATGRSPVTCRANALIAFVTSPSRSPRSLPSGRPDSRRRWLKRRGPRARTSSGTAPGRFDLLTDEGQPAPKGTAELRGAPRRAPLVAYVTSRFPKLSETFVLASSWRSRAAACRSTSTPCSASAAGRAPRGRAVVAARARYYAVPVAGRFAASQLYWLRRRRAPTCARWPTCCRDLGQPELLRRARSPASRRPPTRPGGCRPTASPTSTATSPTIPRWPASSSDRLTGIPFSFTAHGSDLHVDRRMLAAKVAEAAFVATDLRRQPPADRRRSAASTSPRRCTSSAPASTRACSRPSTRNAAGRPRGALTDRVRRHAARGQGPARTSSRPAGCWPPRASTCAAASSATGPDAPTLARADRARPACGPRRARRRRARASRSPPSCAARTRSSRRACRPEQGRREGIPVVLMEAMSTGLPVVASAISGIPELVERRGRAACSCRPRDAAALAGALRAPGRRPRAARAPRGRGPRAPVLAEFDLETSAAEPRRGGSAPEAAAMSRAALLAVAAALIGYTYVLLPRPRPAARAGCARARTAARRSRPR